MFDVPVFAYLDPSTGSIAFQVVMAGLLAAIAAVRLYWKQLKTALFGRDKTR